jgi:hypothetical protein
MAFPLYALPDTCDLTPDTCFLESRVDEAEINEEIRSALAALNPAAQTVALDRV